MTNLHFLIVHNKLSAFIRLELYILSGITLKNDFELKLIKGHCEGKNRTTLYSVVNAVCCKGQEKVPGQNWEQVGA